MRPQPPPDRAALIAALIGLITLWLVIASGCTRPAPELEPIRSRPIPTYCGWAVSEVGHAELVCSDSPERCNRALWWARRLQAQARLATVNEACARTEPVPVEMGVEVVEQKPRVP